MTHYLW